MEILAPAGSPACVTAAVQNGADAIYLGYGDFHARRGAVGFSAEELRAALAYCRVRGVRVYAALNTLLTDRELPRAAALTRELCEAGVDALLVQDLGVLRVVKRVAPDLPVHASTQMSIHNLEGARQAHALGCDRVVLARELTREQVAHIAAHSPIEVEVFVQGALCFAYSGQCYMSAVIGARSGNRGECAGPCRLPYGMNLRALDEYPLSLKDLSLVDHMEELARLGVACAKIEGRLRRPEYVALASRVLSEALCGRRPSPGDRAALERVFSRQGFTDGYYTGRLGPGMFGAHRPEPPDRQNRLYARLRAGCEGVGERQRVPVRFACLLTAGRPAVLGVEDEDGHTVTVEGPVPDAAVSRAALETVVNTQLYKTGGTPYRCVEARTRVEGALSLPLPAIREMRREALERLTARRAKPPDVGCAGNPQPKFSFFVAASRQQGTGRRSGAWKPGPAALARRAPPVLTVQVSRAEQVTPGLLALSPALLYVPLAALAAAEIWEKLESFTATGPPVAAVLPRVITDDEWPEVDALLERAAARGVREVLAGNLGHLAPARARGLTVRGDFGLNIFNSQALRTWKREGLRSAALSFELNLAQVRDLSHCVDTELIVYGRLPLMVTAHCLMKDRAGRCACENHRALVDRTGAHFPVLRETRCRSVLYNARKLFLADRREDWQSLGLWGARLLFTTENPRECVRVVERYLGRGDYEPNDFTRGLCYRNIRARKSTTH
ncbi:MAG: U32 family peptidase [Oscillospiraceae bacterium]|jgi:putative protease|nr:U32 family peptidase [Oscillospiraceae bacterium]